MAFSSAKITDKTTSCAYAAEPEEEGELHNGHEEQEVVLPRRVPLAAPHLREDHPLHRPHQKNPHAQAHPRHHDIVRVCPQEPSNDGQGEPCKQVPTVGYQVKQRHLAPAHRVEEPLQEHDL